MYPHRVQAQPVVSLFSDLVMRADEGISLPAAALALAGVHYPEIDLVAGLDRLAHMRDTARANAERKEGHPLRVLNDTMFDVLGFRGDRENYYDVRNSLFNDVLERRRGIPITLALVYFELADAVGVRVEGVSFPGHFLVRHIDSDRLIDPFDDGHFIDREGCMAILDALGLTEEDWSEDFLRPASRREILHRLLNNLRGCYSRAGDQRRLEVVDEMFTALESGGAIGNVIQ